MAVLLIDIKGTKIVWNNKDKGESESFSSGKKQGQRFAPVTL